MSETKEERISNVIKPYKLSVKLDKKAIILKNFNTIENMDLLEDLSKSNIKYLTMIVSKDFYFSNEMKNIIRSLISNPNIETLDIEYKDIMGECVLNLFSIFISKLLCKNYTIRDIKISHFDSNYLVTPIKIKAFYCLLKSIGNRLVDFDFHYNDKEIKEKITTILLKNCKNIKYIYNTSISNTQIVEKVFYFKRKIEKYILDIKKPFKKDWINLFKSFSDNYDKDTYKGIEINTIEFKSNNDKNIYIDNIDALIEIINSCYIFKVENLMFNFDFNYINNKNKIRLVNEIMRLSLNPENTVKRVYIDILESELQNILNELSLIDYCINSLPQIYLFKYIYYLDLKKNCELVFNYENIQKVKYHKKSEWNLIYNHNPPYSFRNLSLIIEKQEGFEIEIRNISYNIEEFFDSFHFFYKKDFKNIDININCEEQDYYLMDNKNKIITNLYRACDEFLQHGRFNNRSNNIRILTLNFDDKSVYFNILFYTLLDIFIKLRYSIDVIKLEYCSVKDLIVFLEKQKQNQHSKKNSDSNSDSQFITKKIIVYVRDKYITVEDVLKLYYFSSLIQEKIILHLSKPIIYQIGVKIIDEKTKIYSNYSEIIGKIINLVNQTNSNFIEFNFLIETNSNLYFYQRNMNFILNSTDELNDLSGKIQSFYHNTNFPISIKSITITDQCSFESIIKLLSCLKFIIKSNIENINRSIIQEILINTMSKNKGNFRKVYFSSFEVLSLFKYKQYQFKSNLRSNNSFSILYIEKRKSKRKFCKNFVKYILKHSNLNTKIQ